MEIEIMTCDKANANHHCYPKDVVEKAVEEFNKRTENDRTRVVFASGNDDYFNDDFPIEEARTIGRIEKLKLDGNKVMATFHFDKTRLGKNFLKLVSSSPEMTADFINNRVVMSSYGELKPVKRHQDVDDMSIRGFNFALDSAWRKD